MSPQKTVLLAVPISGFAAIQLSPLFVIPEVLTQLILGIEAAVASAVVLSIMLCTSWLRTLSPARQSKTIWFAAGGTTLIVCFGNLLGMLLRR